MAKKDKNGGETDFDSMVKPDEAAAQQQAQFALRHIYLKDASFESPRSPGIFQGKQQPKLDFTVKTRNQKLEDDLYEMVLELTAQAKTDEQSAFLVEVQQAGVFLCKNLNEQQLEQVLAIACPTILYPYAREAVDNLLSKGGFPALMLAPINFEAIYAQRKQAAQKAQQEQGTSEGAPQGAEKGNGAGPAGV